MNLVTLEEAKAHLQMDHDEDDLLISAQIAAASVAVLNYLKGWPIGKPIRNEQGAVILDSSGDPEYIYDSNGDLVVREEIKAATLFMVGHLYRLRDNNEENAFDRGYLPMPVTALLYPLRDPALA
jgi:hypothetical protein